MSHIDGKVAVVTGGGGGFGLLITRMLTERGATAIGFDITDAEGCRVVDVTDREAVRLAVDQVVAEQRPTGVPGTGLGTGILDPAAFPPLAGHNAPLLLSRFDGLRPEQTDPDDVRYWAMTPQELAAHVVYAIDAPAGVNVSDITIRATGEDYVF